MVPPSAPKPDHDKTERAPASRRVAARAGAQTRLSSPGIGGDELRIAEQREARGHVAEMEDRDGLDADDEAGADDGGDDLGDEAGALGTGDAEQARW